MAETGIQKSFESPGVFWLPEKPDQKLVGQLKQTANEGPQVSLVGGVGGLLAQRFPVVHGTLENAPCTLFNCGQSSSKNSYGGLYQTVLGADILLVGEHISSLDEPVFSSSLVNFQSLDEWVGFTAITMGPFVGNIVKTPSRFELATQTSITAKSEEMGGKVTLCGHHTGHVGYRKVNWEYQSFFDIEFDKPASINKLHQSIFELQQLFALLTWHSSPVSYLSASRSIDKNPMNPTGERQSGLYGHWLVASGEAKPSSRLLTCSMHVLEDLPQIISSWFGLPPTVKSARRLLASIIMSKGQYLEFKFLALMQTVEALHRSLNSKNYMSVVDYEKVRQIVTAAIPGNVEADQRSSLESRIRYGNEFSLRTRFKELFLRLPEKLRPHICNDWKAFVGRAVDMRNTLVHPNTDGSSVQPDPTQMWKASERIKLLLTITFLNELGFSFDKIEKIAASGQWHSIVRE